MLDWLCSGTTTTTVLSCPRSSELLANNPPVVLDYLDGYSKADWVLALVNLQSFLRGKLSNGERQRSTFLRQMLDGIRLSHSS